MEKHTCCASVFVDYHSYRCGRGAKYEEGGKWYCGTHLPSKIKARRDAATAKWQAEWESQRKQTEAEAELKRNQIVVLRSRLREVLICASIPSRLVDEIIAEL